MANDRELRFGWKKGKVVLIDELKQAVESQHGGRATFVHAVHVHEEHGGQTVWDGKVSVFDLRGQPDGAFRAYAWCDKLADGGRQFVATLHTPQIIGPREAVRAAMVAAEAQTGKGVEKT
jgi:hypothetical protein